MSAETDQQDTMKALQALVDASPSVEQLTVDKEYSAPARKDGATVTESDPLFTSPAPAPKDAKGPSVPPPAHLVVDGPILPPAAAAAPVAAAPQVIASPDKIFLTGRTGVGKSYLAEKLKAQVLDQSAPLVAAARSMFPGAKAVDFAALLPTIHAWGEGIIDKNHPLTPARWLFIRSARTAEGWDQFGTPGFWVSLLLNTASNLDGRVAITNVTTAAEFAALKAAGFSHYHVMTSPAAIMTRQRRQNADDRLATALDQDAIKKVSAQRQGDRLPVVWNAPENPPSPRLWTVPEWLNLFDAAPVEIISAFE